MTAAPQAAAPDLTIQVAAEEEGASWDEFVRAHPSGTFFHLFGWRRVVRDGLRHPVYYLAARRAGIHVARQATASKSSVIPANVSGSAVVTPKSSPRMVHVSAAAVASPATSPTAARV